MMAKMFYTLEEAKNALGRSEDEIKAYAREGRLREFRDGPRLMFKADQVEQLRSDLGSSDDADGLDQVDLGVSDSGGMIGLVDTTGASGTSITLSDADTGGSSGSAMKFKDDTALAADLGLSGTMGGSLGGVPSPGRPGGSGSGTGLHGTAAGRSGINVFSTDDSIERVDPSAQTAISGGIRDQIDLQGVGSGSGLLDLTRESDDTSLGAVLDEITPAGRRGGSMAGSMAGSMGGSYVMDASDTGGMGSVMVDDDPAPITRGPAAAPVMIEADDPFAPAFGGAALATAGVLLFGIFVLISSVMGTRPDAVTWFVKNNINMWSGAGIGFAIVAVCFIVGLVLGRLGKAR